MEPGTIIATIIGVAFVGFLIWKWTGRGSSGTGSGAGGRGGGGRDTKLK